MERSVDRDQDIVQLSQGAKVMNSSRVLGLAIIVACASGSTLAAPLSLPYQRPGLWQQTMTQDGKKSAMASSQLCLDAASEAKLAALGAQVSDKNCPTKKLNHNADGSWSLDGTCSFPSGWKTKSHASIGGDFNSRITTTIDATTTGAPTPAMNGAHHTVVTAVRLGACKPGQKGGDVVMGDGTKMNLLDLGSAQPGAGPH
jgi:hypothetical protein